MALGSPYIYKYEYDFVKDNSYVFNSARIEQWMSWCDDNKINYTFDREYETRRPDRYYICFKSAEDYAWFKLTWI